MKRYETAEFKELVDIQNELDHTDIISITGFMNNDQFLEYVKVQRARLSKSKGAE